MSDEVAVPRTRTGKRVSPASLQRHREYVDWLVTLPDPRRDDESRDDSYEDFAAQRLTEQLQAAVRGAFTRRRKSSFQNRRSLRPDSL